MLNDILSFSHQVCHVPLEKSSGLHAFYTKTKLMYIIIWRVSIRHLKCLVDAVERRSMSCNLWVFSLPQERIFLYMIRFQIFRNYVPSISLAILQMTRTAHHPQFPSLCFSIHHLSCSSTLCHKLIHKN